MNKEENEINEIESLEFSVKREEFNHGPQPYSSNILVAAQQPSQPMNASESMMIFSSSPHKEPSPKAPEPQAAKKPKVLKKQSRQAESRNIQKIKDLFSTEEKFK